jgi:lysophospholipase L1-like esterase
MTSTIVVGDSLGVGTVPHLRGVVGSDVRVGRSSADGVNALAVLLRRHNADRIVLDLGTNDGSAQQLRRSVRRAVQLADGRPIYVPTVNGPGAAQKNAVLRQLSGQGVHLVNWAAQSHGLVGADGIHATASGYRTRAQIIEYAMGGNPAPSSTSVPARAPTPTTPQASQDSPDRAAMLAQFLGAANAPAPSVSMTPVKLRPLTPSKPQRVSFRAPRTRRALMHARRNGSY